MRPNVYSADAIVCFLQAAGLPESLLIQAKTYAGADGEQGTSFRDLYRQLSKWLRAQRARELESPEHRALIQFLTGGLPPVPAQAPSILDLTEQLDPAYLIFGPVSQAQNMRLAIAAKISLFGPGQLLREIEDRWNRRHDLPAQPSKTKTRKKRPALSRLLVALLRFALGFFGSHKVDAQNNP